MKAYFKKLIALIIGLAVMIGIPYLFGGIWLLFSWLPGLFVMMLLED